jgi:hypothetical protein
MLQDDLDIIDVNDRAVFIQYLDKPAHVCSLEMVRQINRKRNRGHGVLRGMRFISDLDGESEIRDSDAVDSHFPMIGLVLRIHKSGELLRVHRSRN